LIHDRPAGSSAVPVATALAAVVLPDAEGAPHRLGDLWADRPAVVEFLRHYG
jgi:hypothetical protein